MQKIIVLLFLFFASCSEESPSPLEKQRGDYITRKSSHPEPKIARPKERPRPLYPWESPTPHPLITKEHFRCKGSTLNPTRMEPTRLDDCGGALAHGLPLRDNKEYIYPVLLELMNYLQEKTKKRVIITSGHRCPKHHEYARRNGEPLASKHLLGAEVAFYVEGMEKEPEKVVQLLMNYYKERTKEASYLEFQRNIKLSESCRTAPWANKEILIKLYQPDEGRNFDNRHPNPYLSIQVRFDREKNAPISFSWEQATKNYLRY